MDKLKRLTDLILNLIFPPKCCVCGTIGDDSFCPKCVSQIKFMPYTGRATASVAVYEGTIKKAIKKFKFNKKKRLAQPLAKIMLDNLPFKDFDIIIPVPLHKIRSKGRGFNQSELLAKDISDFHKVPVLTDILVRVKNTVPQFELKKGERLKNIKGAFAVTDPDIIRRKNILLIDDIMTTGATTNECAKILFAAGAKRVFVYALARALI
jgi:ComF family protein